MAKSRKSEALNFKDENDADAAQKPYLHKLFNGAICETDSLGHKTPGGRSPNEIVVDASEGFVPLWAPDVSLRWRFNESSMAMFRKPKKARNYLRELLADGIMLWENAPPVKFKEVQDGWDFEIAVNPTNNCNSQGACTLARAFFPDGGRHDLLIYPKMFELDRKEQVETMAHELGHVFGLRHFFALIDEQEWPAQMFGKHSPFSIMNYGENSVMTDNDIADLTALYQAVWSGKLTHINSTEIRIIQPFSAPLPQTANWPIAASNEAAKGCRCCCCC